MSEFVNLRAARKTSTRSGDRNYRVKRLDDRLGSEIKASRTGAARLTARGRPRREATTVEAIAARAVGMRDRSLSRPVRIVAAIGDDDVPLDSAIFSGNIRIVDSQASQQLLSENREAGKGLAGATQAAAVGTPIAAVETKRAEVTLSGCLRRMRAKCCRTIETMTNRLANLCDPRCFWRFAKCSIPYPSPPFRIGA